MEAAVVLEPYGPVGFALCAHLLDKGIPVFYAEGMWEEGNSEEKKLYFARNSNFRKLTSPDFTGLPVFLPFYDWLIRKDFAPERAVSFLEKVFPKGREGGDRVWILLWPASMEGREEWLRRLSQDKVIVFDLPVQKGDPPDPFGVFPLALGNPSKNERTAEGTDAASWAEAIARLLEKIVRPASASWPDGGRSRTVLSFSLDGTKGWSAEREADANAETEPEREQEREEGTVRGDKVSEARGESAEAEHENGMRGKKEGPHSSLPAAK